MTIKTLISDRFKAFIVDNKSFVITSKKYVNETLASVSKKQFIESIRKRSSK